MSINFNDEAYNIEGSNVKIFNDGNAGIVENVTVTLERKKPEDKENSPNYKVVFTDASGGNCSMSFWYVTDGVGTSTLEDMVKKQGKSLKHLIHAVCGSDFAFPVFSGAEDMLDKCMNILRGALQPGLKFRVFANYGSTQKVKEFIQVRSWVPFIETMTVPSTESRLVVSKIDAMERLQKDTVSPNTEVVKDGEDW